jgi:hypothetical protein
MYARLNLLYGWTWPAEDGSPGPFILDEIERYKGMICGFTPDGRKCTRPLMEFDALSQDGITWQPTKTLFSQVPLESYTRVRTRDLPLPISLDKDQD